MSQELSVAELSRLQDALYAVLALVAGADGSVDAKEVKRFSQMLEAARGGADSLLAGVAAAALTSCDERLKSPLMDTPRATELVREAAALADGKLSAEAARRFKQGLYLMGTQLAMASGGGVLGLGGRTSDEERKALTELSQLLGLVG